MAATAAAIFSIYCFGCASGEASGGFSGCAPSRGEAFNFYAMNTAIYAEATDKPFNQNEGENIRNLFLSLEKEFSASEKDSFISRFNEAKAGEKTEVSDTGKALFKLCEKACALTEGRFNPAVLPLSELWGFYPDFPKEDFTPPQSSEIEKILNSGEINYENVRFLDGDGTVYKENSATKIELGGILKGYAADEAGKILLDAGHTSGYVNAGGSSLFILGAKTLGIRHPRKTGENLLSFNIENRKNFSVSTSGDYERFYEYGGERYCHVIDVKSGRPIETGVMQVTIIGGENEFSGALADAFSTALMTESFSENLSEGSENALLALAEKLLNAEGFEKAVFFIAAESDKGNILFTNAEEKSFTLKDESYRTVYF